MRGQVGAIRFTPALENSRSKDCIIRAAGRAAGLPRVGDGSGGV